MPHNRKAITPKINSGITCAGKGNTNGSAIYINKKISKAPPAKTAPSSSAIRSNPFSLSSERIGFFPIFLNILKNGFIITYSAKKQMKLKIGTDCLQRAIYFFFSPFPRPYFFQLNIKNFSHRSPLNVAYFIIPGI